MLEGLGFHGLRGRLARDRAGGQGREGPAEHELELPTADVIDIDVLKKDNLVPAFVTKVKVIKSGELDKAVKLKGIAVTKGAREVIEKAGGSIEA